MFPFACLTSAVYLATSLFCYRHPVLLVSLYVFLLLLVVLIRHRYRLGRPLSFYAWRRLCLAGLVGWVVAFLLGLLIAFLQGVALPTILTSAGFLVWYNAAAVYILAVLAAWR